MTRVATARDALGELRRAGLLTLTGPATGPVPGLASLVAGEDIRGSWWGHASGAAIFNVASELGDHPDVIVCKLVAGKVTFVHRRLWPALRRYVTDAGRRERLSAHLPARARKLLEEAGRGDVRIDLVLARDPVHRREWSRAKNELVRRSLVAADEVHTEAGRHSTVLRSWESVFASRNAAPALRSLEEAVAILEKAGAAVGLATESGRSRGPRASGTVARGARSNTPGGSGSPGPRGTPSRSRSRRPRQ